MKKYLFVLCLLVSSFTHALDGQGTVEEIINCSTGEEGKLFWKQVMLFRLSDGKWFGVYADYASGTATDYDSNFAVSMVMTAFAAKNLLNVRATYSTRTDCGIEAKFIWQKAGDYIKLTR